MNTLKAALFDLDGTLVDTEGQYSVFWEEVGKTYCPHIPDLAKRIKGTTLTQMFNLYFTDPEIQRVIRKGLDEWEMGMEYVFYPGALELLHELKGHGLKTALVTSSDSTKMRNVYRKVQGFQSLFDSILTSEDFSASKPNPDCYLRAAEMLGCELDECVVFEDALSGLEAGMRSGIFTIGVATTNSREAIANRCHYVLDGLHELTYERLLRILGEHA